MKTGYMNYRNSIGVYMVLCAVLALAFAFLPSSASAQTSATSVACPVGFICTPETPTSVTPPISNPACFYFTRNLGWNDGSPLKNMSHEPDVHALQNFLISRGYAISSSEQRGGAVFGATTWAAVRAFQAANGVPATGYLGAMTRAILNDSCGSTDVGNNFIDKQTATKFRLENNRGLSEEADSYIFLAVYNGSGNVVPIDTFNFPNIAVGAYTLKLMQEEGNNRDYYRADLMVTSTGYRISNVHDERGVRLDMSIRASVVDKYLQIGVQENGETQLFRFKLTNSSGFDISPLASAGIGPYFNSNPGSYIGKVDEIHDGGRLSNEGTLRVVVNNDRKSVTLSEIDTIDPIQPRFLPDLIIKSARPDSTPYTYWVNLCMNGGKSINDLKLENRAITSYPFHYNFTDYNGNTRSISVGAGGSIEDIKNGQCTELASTIQPNDRSAFDASNKIVRIVVDQNNVIREIDETNNQVTFNFATTSTRFSIVSPNGGSYSSSTSLNVSWTSPERTDFDHYYLMLGNRTGNTSITLTPGTNVSKTRTTFSVSSANLNGAIRDLIANSRGKTAEQMKNSYYVIVEAVKSDRVGGSVVARAEGGSFSINTPSVDNNSRRQAVINFYQTLLGRQPNETEITYWASTRSDLDLVGVKKGFTDSAEYRARRAYVANFYLDLLKRSSSDVEVDYWANNGLTRDQIRAGIVGSNEYNNLSSYHSADYNHDYKINGSEISRVLSYYRAGGYHCDSAGYDGYASGVSTAHNCAFHSADYNKDWKISLYEAITVMTLWYSDSGYRADSSNNLGFTAIDSAIQKPLTCGNVGDINNDGKIMLSDEISMRIYYLYGGAADVDGISLNSLFATDAQKSNADVNNDGIINTTDAELIHNYVKGLITTFPKCTNNSAPTMIISSSTVSSGGTTKINFTFPSNTVRSTLYLACPSGVNTGTSPDLCNTSIPVTSNNDYSLSLFNTTPQSQMVVPTYSIYKSDNPYYAYGIVGSITVLANNTLIYHPADTNQDGRLNLSETIRYGARLGNTSEVRIAREIYQRGEMYTAGDISGTWNVRTWKNASGVVVVDPGRDLACGTLGDIDNDGKIGTKDYDVWRVIMSGRFTGTDELKNRADVNKDGQAVSVLDGTLLLRYIEGFSNTFPGCAVSATPVITSVSAPIYAGESMTLNGRGFTSTSKLVIDGKYYNSINSSLSISSDRISFIVPTALGSACLAYDGQCTGAIPPEGYPSSVGSHTLFVVNGVGATPSDKVNFEVRSRAPVSRPTVSVLSTSVTKSTREFPNDQLEVIFRVRINNTQNKPLIFSSRPSTTCTLCTNLNPFVVSVIRDGTPVFVSNQPQSAGLPEMFAVFSLNNEYVISGGHSIPANESVELYYTFRLQMRKITGSIGGRYQVQLNGLATDIGQIDSDGNNISNAEFMSVPTDTITPTNPPVPVTPPPTTPVALPTVTLSLNDRPISTTPFGTGVPTLAAGTDMTVTWSSVGADSCTVRDVIENGTRSTGSFDSVWSGSKDSSPGNHSQTIRIPAGMTPGLKTIGIQCLNSAGWKVLNGYLKVVAPSAQTSSAIDSFYSAVKSMFSR